MGNLPVTFLQQPVPKNKVKLGNFQNVILWHLHLVPYSWRNTLDGTFFVMSMRAVLPVRQTE